LDKKCRNPLVASPWINAGKEHKEPRFLAISNPEFTSIEDVIAPLQGGASLQGKSVGAGTSLAQRVGAAGVGCHARKVALFLLVGTPAQQGVIDQRILYIDDYACGSVDPRHFLDCQNCLKEFPATAAVLFRNFNTHQPEL